VSGALLVAPPDTERDDMPPQLHGWRPIVMTRLPFPATVVASSNDPYCSLERAGMLASAWGASLVVAGPRGHLNAESGLGDWPEGLALLHELTA
jgi:predicted alpha/beta hydrolase family esterase